MEKKREYNKVCKRNHSTKEFNEHVLGIIERLPMSQAGAGRHKCALCAFKAGKQYANREKLQPGNNFFVQLSNIICEAKPELSNVVESMFSRFIGLKNNREGYILSISSNKVKINFGNLNKIFVYANLKKQAGVIYMDVPEFVCDMFDFPFDDFKELYIHALRLKADRLSSGKR